MIPVLSITGLYKHFNGVVALDGFDCAVRKGEIVALVGPNGAGKTTLFNVVTGFLLPDAGAILKDGCQVIGKSPYQITSMGIGRTFQKLRLVLQASVLDNVLLWFQKQPGERVSLLFARFRQCRNSEQANREKALGLLGEVGMQNMADELAGNLSYGQQKLLSIACCIAAKAEVLLLDEPVAGIAPHMVDKILGTIKGLRDSGLSLMMIEHDLDAIEKVADRVIFMNLGKKVCEGTLEEIRKNPIVIEAYL